MNVYLQSATDLAASIRARAVTSREVVLAHIARAKRVNGTLNAIVAERYDAALAEANAADERIAREGTGSLPPFHGVPCTIKEAFALTGMPNTSGLRARMGIRSVGDATAVDRLRKAGAIPIGVTNVSELCMWMESHNRVYGMTNNPYDRRRTVGGSSGGEGAIVGSGASPFGLGSDIGGSIRMPAFFNGVFGHKPTGGLVPGTGQFPTGENEARRYVTTGPICRRASDLWPLLTVLAGPDGADAGCVPFELGDPASVDVSRLEVYDVAENGRLRVDPELRRAQERVAAYLKGRGAKVRALSLDKLRHSFEIWASMLHAAGGESFGSLLAQGGEFRGGLELAKWAVGRSPHTLPAIGLALLEKVPQLGEHKIDRFVALGRELRAELDGLLSDHAILLYPSYPKPAPFHYTPLVPPFQWLYTAIINVLELPSTQVPLGLGRQGVPLGVQVVGAHGRDHVTIAVAMELERAFGGWVFPGALSACAE